MSFDPLKEKAQALLDAAYAYWRECQKAGVGGAVQWLDDESGHTVIFTRGEYRPTLMSNIDQLRADGAVLHFNALDTWMGHDRRDEFPDGRPQIIDPEKAS